MRGVGTERRVTRENARGINSEIYVFKRDGDGDGVGAWVESKPHTHSSERGMGGRGRGQQQEHAASRERLAAGPRCSWRYLWIVSRWSGWGS